VRARDDEDARRYAELTTRSAARINVCAMVINLMIIASTWGRWQQFAIAAVGHTIVVFVNYYVSAVLVPRFGARVDLVRAVFNTAVCSVLYQFIDWPLPVWFWLPFCALTFHEFGGRNSIVVLVIMCIIQGGAGIACGVPAEIPLVFVGLTVVCRLVATQRTAIIREMLATADRQRAELARAEVELRQAQKLEAIGRLAAGVAHEINTPMQFIGDSLSFVRDGVGDLLAGPLEAGEVAYLRAQLPTAIERAHTGVVRVAKIVQSMKQFASDNGDIVPADVNAAIQDALVIATRECEQVADVAVDLGDLPLVPCDGAAIRQVLLGLVSNAAQAIAEANTGSDRRGTIAVSSRRAGDGVRIAVADTGTGIADAACAHIFDPFFTTKPVGRGVGQSLATARAIVERHRGRISFVTEVGKGTTFEVYLPVAEARAAA
jgi:signal transduction histidine kinase